MPMTEAQWAHNRKYLLEGLCPGAACAAAGIKIEDHAKNVESLGANRQETGSCCLLASEVVAWHSPAQRAA